MKKVISFSLWGDDPKYTIGAIKNAELAKEIYPGWVCRFYTANTVPEEIMKELSSHDNVEIVARDTPGDWTSMYWRFEPVGEEDIDIVIVRDADGRLDNREKHAVEEWLRSDKGFHIMRDHPAHRFHVMPGMFGSKKGTIKDMKNLIDSFSQTDEYGTDYLFFANVIYPRVSANSIVHDEFFDKKSFPTPRVGLEFVGKVYDHEENTVVEHEQHLDYVLKRMKDENR